MRHLAAGLIVLWLAGCGFQLQGRQPLPATLSAITLETDDLQTEFAHELRLSLRASGVQVSTSERSAAPPPPGSVTTSAPARLRIVRDQVEEHVLSVSARNIPTDYELIYKVTVDVRADGKELLPDEEFSLSRVYSFDETKLLAKEREKEILVQALARDLASVVMRRLAAL